jgi:hypothetical protein
VGQGTRAFFVALALHALVAVLLWRVPPAREKLPPSYTALEWTLAVQVSPPPALGERVQSAADEVAPRPRFRRRRVASLTNQTAATTPSASPAADPTLAAAGAAASGTAQLFPRGILEALAGHPANNSVGRDHDSGTPGDWLDDAAAEARTRAGQVEPVWRDVERELVRRFRPRG